LIVIFYSWDAGNLFVMPNLHHDIPEPIPAEQSVELYDNGVDALVVRAVVDVRFSEQFPLPQ
jgi:hypothetical protein